MKEIYEKIYIKSESDLPKKTGNYFVAEKDNNKYIFLCSFECNNVMSKLWLRDIDWYLQPIELPSEKLISEEASKQVSLYLKARNNPTVDLHKRFVHMAKWMLSQIKGKE